MKNNFPEYYRPEFEELKEASKDAVFIFDTNTLLDFYRVSPAIADKALKAVEQYKDRIYITRHIDEEYHRHHYEVPAQMLNTVEQIISRIKFNDIKTAFLNQFKCNTGCTFPQDLLNNYVGLLEKTYNDIFQEINGLNQHFKDNFLHHKLQHRISGLFEDRILNVLSEKQIEDIIKKSGPDRFEKGIPPGYKDAGKATDTDDRNCYGDLIIWMEILEFVKSDPKHVFFICRDEKEDWIERVGLKTLGPRMELIVEFRKCAPGKIFHIYTLTRFLEIFGEDFSEEELEAIPVPKTFQKPFKGYMEFEDIFGNNSYYELLSTILNPRKNMARIDDESDVKTRPFNSEEEKED